MGLTVSSVTQLCLTLCDPMDCSMPVQHAFAITNSWRLLKLMSIDWAMPSNHLILYRPLLLLHSIFPSTGSFPKSHRLLLFLCAPDNIHLQVAALHQTVQNKSLTLRDSRLFEEFVQFDVSLCISWCGSCCLINLFWNTTFDLIHHFNGNLSEACN